MLIFCSILFVSVAFIMTSRVYKKMYPGMKLHSNEVILIPFRFVILGWGGVQGQVEDSG